MDKKNKNSNVPNLRFNGYTENWQKYRTIELGQMQRGKSKHRPRDDEKLYGGAYPFIQTGDIKKQTYISKNTKEPIQIMAYLKVNYGRKEHYVLL